MTSVLILIVGSSTFILEGVVHSTDRGKRSPPLTPTHSDTVNNVWDPYTTAVTATGQPFTSRPPTNPDSEVVTSVRRLKGSMEGPSSLGPDVRTGT